MANIMLTDLCNLKCPYCFANEFVNTDVNHITKENFIKAVDFICTNPKGERVGFIGGEPTLHPQFRELLQLCIRDNRIPTITIFTNGTNLEPYYDIVTNKKVQVLINCNTEENMGTALYNKMLKNIDYLFNEACADNISLGINMYKPDFKYDYILDLLKKYGLNRVRTAITVPNFDNDRNKDAFTYFKLMKLRVLCFFKECLQNGIAPGFDCNHPPICIIADDEIQEILNEIGNNEVKGRLGNFSLERTAHCKNSVVDIRQDLTAVRCFGMSLYTKQKITDFNTISELRGYYSSTVDCYMFNTVYNNDCVSCKHRKNSRCSGGCLAYKVDKINKLRNLIENNL